MPLISRAPFVQNLLEIQAVLETCDFVADAGVSTAMTIRHSRNRKPVRGERPALTIIFVGDVYEQGDSGHSQDEIVRRMTVDLQYDLELATEDSDDDPTGLELLGRVDAVALHALRVGPNAMIGRTSDWIIAGDINPEDRATPDEGRMTRAIDVLYRVGAVDGNVLLAPEENL